MPESNHQRITGIDVDINCAIRCAIAIGQSVLPIDLHRTLKPHDSLAKVFRCIVHLGNSFLFTAENFSFLIADLGIAAHIGIGDLLDTALSVHIGNGVLLNGKPSFIGFPLHLLRLRLHIDIELSSSLFSCSSDTLGIFRLGDRLFTGLRNVLRSHFDSGNILCCVSAELYAGQLGECLSCGRVVIDASSYALVSCYTGKGAVVGFLSCVCRIINCGRKSLPYAVLCCSNRSFLLLTENLGHNRFGSGFYTQGFRSLDDGIGVIHHRLQLSNGKLRDIALDFGEAAFCIEGLVCFEQSAEHLGSGLLLHFRCIDRRGCAFALAQAFLDLLLYCSGGFLEGLAQAVIVDGSCRCVCAAHHAACKSAEEHIVPDVVHLVTFARERFLDGIVNDIFGTFLQAFLKGDAQQFTAGRSSQCINAGGFGHQFFGCGLPKFCAAESSEHTADLLCGVCCGSCAKAECKCEIAVAVLLVCVCVLVAEGGYRHQQKTCRW